MYFGRGKNKIQDLRGLSDMYNYYVERFDNDLYKVDFKIYKEIINKYFKAIMQDILYKPYKLKIPHRLGGIRIIKRKVNINKLTRFGINWPETVKHNKIIYHLNSHSKNYIYRFKWEKENSITPNLYFYKFVPSRQNKRELAKIIKNRECDYFE